MNSTVRHLDRLGWVSAPNTRGTIDIIWSCALTLFLCCWSILVLNVPAPGASSWSLIRSKWCILLLNAVAPELVFQVALGQWVSARRSLRLFHESGYKTWTIQHAFYADMGALHLRTPDFKSFPIDAKQLHYLVVNGYIDYPSIPDSHIRDKNKVDGMLRLITLMQSLWFIVNLIGRAAQGLVITALELSTSAWVLMGVATSFCWLSKPADVEGPDYITTHVSMAQILCEAGEKAAGIYYYTPLDFVSRDEWPWSRLWSHALNLLRMTNIAAPSSVKPMPHFQNTVVPRLDFVHHIFLIGASIAYFVIFILAWNFSFPTTVELILWRVMSFVGPGCACVIMFNMYIPALYEWITQVRKAHGKQSEDAGSQEGLQSYKQTNLERGGAEIVSDGTLIVPLPSHSSNSTSHSLPRDDKKRKNGSKMSLVARLARTFRNNSILRDPQLDTPPLFILSVWVFGFAYCLSRAYIIVADFVELRSLPPSAFQTVEWWAFLPHWN